MTRAATAGRKQNAHLMVNASKRTTVTTTELTWDWHNTFFRNANRRNATELSEQYMDPDGRKQTFLIKWKVLKKFKPDNNINKKCNLCLHEKFISVEKILVA